jgi:hypothetical protein
VLSTADPIFQAAIQGEEDDVAEESSLADVPVYITPISHHHPHVW